MAKKHKVAAVQMTSTADVEDNLQIALGLAEQAIEDGAELVVLPECFAYLGPEDGKFAIAEELPGGETKSAPSFKPGPILDRCRDVARARNAELVLGGFYEKTPDPKRVRNACVHIDAGGNVKAVYRKIHLFDVDLADGTTLRESAGVEAGTEVVVTDTAFGKLGLTVCYDVRFPELYRALVDKGAIAITVPAAFTLTTGKDHWHVLLRARAIESQCYVIAAAQFGKHFGTRVSYGHALICDPWGTIVAECSDGPGYAIASIDHATIERIRASLPSLRHRRL
jgi:predicted amidohydrolase